MNISATDSAEVIPAIIQHSASLHQNQIESVYFEGKRPLFVEPGDHIGKLLESLERQHEPATVIKDYEDTHAFLFHILSCLKPAQSDPVRSILESRYPGYDVNRKITGCLFPDHVAIGHGPGTKYDDELPVSWKP